MTAPFGGEADRKKLADAMTVGGYRLGSLAARLMPSPVAAMAASSLGFTASFASLARRQMFQRHMRRVNPKITPAALRLATQQAFDSYAQYYMESFRLPTLSKRAIRTSTAGSVPPSALSMGRTSPRSRFHLPTPSSP